jgi:TRF2-interacting telomeric protein/Rap1
MVKTRAQEKASKKRSAADMSVEDHDNSGPSRKEVCINRVSPRHASPHRQNILNVTTRAQQKASKKRSAADISGEEDNNAGLSRKKACINRVSRISSVSPSPSPAPIPGADATNPSQTSAAPEQPKLSHKRRWDLIEDWDVTTRSTKLKLEQTRPPAQIIKSTAKKAAFVPKSSPKRKEAAQNKKLQRPVSPPKQLERSAEVISDNNTGAAPAAGSTERETPPSASVARSAGDTSDGKVSSNTTAQTTPELPSQDAMPGASPKNETAALDSGPGSEVELGETQWLLFGGDLKDIPGLDPKLCEAYMHHCASTDLDIELSDKPAMKALRKKWFQAHSKDMAEYMKARKVEWSFPPTIRDKMGERKKFMNTDGNGKKLNKKVPRPKVETADARLTEMYYNALPYDPTKIHKDHIPESEIVNTTKSTVKKYDKFKSQQLEKNHPLEKIVEVIFATSGDFQLAAAVLRNKEESDDPIPDHVPGVWTEEDDNDLVTVGSRKLNFTNLPAVTDPLERLDMKHGFNETVPIKVYETGWMEGKRQKDPSSLRIIFLRHWRSSNWMQIDVDEMMSFTPGLRHWETYNA